MQVVIAPDARLRIKTKPVKKINQALKNTLKEMVKLIKTYKDPEGVGLAATQVGLEESFFVAKNGQKFIWVVNPKIISTSKRTKKYFEGCLSVPNIWDEVKRATNIKVTYQDLDRKTVTIPLKGVLAWIFQHEIDHLNGILFSDRVLQQQGRFYKFTGKDKTRSDTFQEVTIEYTIPVCAFKIKMLNFKTKSDLVKTTIQNSNLQYPQITPLTQNLFTNLLKQKGLSEDLSKSKSHDEVRIIYFGTPQFSAYVLEKLIQFCDSTNASSRLPNQYSVRSHTILSKKYIVQAVITGSDKPSPVALVAEKYKIPLLYPDKLDKDFIENHLSYLESELFIVVSYGQIIPRKLLDIPKLGAINIHGSLLPKYRGSSPIQQTILNGDKETGVTLMLMDEQIDHGPIIAAKEISISEQDNYQSLSNKMQKIAASFLLEILPQFVEGKINLRLQNETIATYCNRLTRESGYFDINNPLEPEVLDKMIRAYYPWPGVWTRWKEKIVKFYPEGKIQMEGKKVMSIRDFLNGYPDFPLRILS